MEDKVPAGSICCFCQCSDDDEALYGKFYKYKDIITHYFCLLLASKILQRGSDEDGILGFLPKDIENEIKRGKTLTCMFCRKRGATIGCYNSKCKVHFHLTCGRKKDTFHQFFGQFKSYCPRHRLKQRIDAQVLKSMRGKESVNCVICLESVPATPAPNTLWAPCCSKEAWFHRLCVQRLALSAGYFFKCPLCNNTKQFVEAMRTYGIWVPEQDASWEAEPERYSSLLERHNSCDAKSCRCRQGRTFHLDNTKWEIKLCIDCGSQGMHVQCGNLRLNDNWVCSICSSVVVQKENLVQANRGAQESQDRPRGQNVYRRATRRGRRVIRRVSTRQSQPPADAENEEDEEDEEVDVVGNKEQDESSKGKCDDQQQTLPLESRTALLPSPQTSLPENPSSDISFPKKKVLEPHSRPRINQRHSCSDQQSSSAAVAQSQPEDAPAVSSVEKKCTVEIINLDDDSDDDVQILYTPNVKFIKTNHGVSVPVVNVPIASAPSGDGLVASGEPCQRLLQNISSTVDLVDDSESDVVIEECLPSTSSTNDSGEQPISSMTEILVTGEPPQSDDDDDIEIVEISRQIPSVSIVRHKLIDISTQTLSSQTGDSVEDKIIGRYSSRKTQNSVNCEVQTIDQDDLPNGRLEEIFSIQNQNGNSVKLLDSSSSTEGSKPILGNRSLIESPYVRSSVLSHTVQGSPNPILCGTSILESYLIPCRRSVIQKVPSYVDSTQRQAIKVDNSSVNRFPLPSNPSGTVSSGWTTQSMSLNGPIHSRESFAPPPSSTKVTVVHPPLPLPSSTIPPGTHAVLSHPPSMPVTQSAPLSMLGNLSSLSSQGSSVSLSSQGSLESSSALESRAYSRAQGSLASMPAQGSLASMPAQGSCTSWSVQESLVSSGGERSLASNQANLSSLPVQGSLSAFPIQGNLSAFPDQGNLFSLTVQGNLDALKIPLSTFENHLVPQSCSKSSYVSNSVFSTPQQASLSNSVGFATSSRDIVNSSLKNSIPHVLDGPQSTILYDTFPSQRQVFYQLPKQAGQSDWSYSVQVVPENEKSESEDVSVYNSEDQPEVIMERSPRPVASASTFWSQMDDISVPVVQADISKEFNQSTTTSTNDLSRVTSDSRVRKQKVVERSDFKKVRLFPPALMQLCPGSFQQNTLLQKGFVSNSCHLSGKSSTK